MAREIKIFIFTALFNVVLVLSAQADTVYLKNNDKLSGKITKQTPNEICVDSEAMGLICIKTDYVDKIITQNQQKALQETAKTDTLWEKELTAGYNKSTGNTTNSQAYFSIFLNRNNPHVNEWTLKGNLYYYSSDRKMSAQKWYVMNRYAFSFGKNKRFYNFYRIESDHDKFADIDYRIIPAAGVGYWFFDQDDLKALTEIAAGIEYTNYKSATPNRRKGVLIPRFFLEKEIFSNIIISEDFYYYPEFDDFSLYRISSATSLVFKINSRIAISFNIIDSYNSNPPKDTKNNDVRFISALKCSF